MFNELQTSYCILFFFHPCVTFTCLTNQFLDGSDVLLAPYQKRPKGTTRFCTSFMTKNMDIGSVVGNTAALDMMFKEGPGSQILRGPGPGREFNSSSLGKHYSLPFLLITPLPLSQTSTRLMPCFRKYRDTRTPAL